MNTPISSMLWVITAGFVGSFGAVFLKLGASRLDGKLASLLTNWRLGMGVGFYLLSSVFFVLGVRHGELSVLFPMVSLASVWTLMWSRLFLGERITRSKVIALGLILMGITVLGFGNR